jgi:hypothetical protein
VVGHGRSVKVEPDQVQSWFADLLPVAGTEDEVDEEADDSEPVEPPPPEVEAIPRPPAAASAEITAATQAADAQSIMATVTAPPTEGPAVVRRRGNYSSAVLAAGTAQRVLLGTALTTIIAAVTLWVLNSRLEAFKTGASDTFDAALSVARLADWGTRPLVLIGVAASLWYVMRWTAVAYANIPSFGRTRLRLPLSAVPWSFLVPGLNVVAPRRLINDAWRAADEGHFGGQDWMLQPGNRWTGIAWLAGAGGTALHFAGWLVGNASVDAAITSNRLAMLGYVAACGALLSGVMMIQRVTERQEARNAELDEIAEAFV